MFLVLDLFYYIFHLLGHRVSFFWHLHQVHHQDTVFNHVTAYRIGIFETFLMTVVLLPIALAGVPPRVIFLSLAVQALFMGWIHTSIPKGPRWFEYIFNTASHHRMHHLKLPGYRHPNCGGLLIIWDRLFGTFSPEQDLRHDFGVTGHVQRISPIRDLFFGAFENVDGPFTNPKGSVWDIDWHLALWLLLSSSWTILFGHADGKVNVLMALAATAFLEFNLFPRDRAAFRWLFRALCLSALASMWYEFFPRVIARPILFVAPLVTLSVLLGVLYAEMLRARRDTARVLGTVK